MKQTISALKDFWKLLPIDVEANLKFAREIAKGNMMHQYYFFGDYSKPILSWIIVKALEKPATKNIERDIFGKYYEFVAGPFKDSTPQWYQLLCYKGLNGEKLHSWLKRNGRQWFTKEKIKEEKLLKKMLELLDFKDYTKLVDVEDDSEVLSQEKRQNKERLSIAWKKLSDKDQEILQLLVMDKLYWEEAWEELNKYVNPKKGREVIQMWDNKLKQDALARLKSRALKHLIINYNLAELNEEN